MHAAGSVEAVTRQGRTRSTAICSSSCGNYMFNSRNVFALQRDSLKRTSLAERWAVRCEKTSCSSLPAIKAPRFARMPLRPWPSFPQPPWKPGILWLRVGCLPGYERHFESPFVNDQINPGLLSPAALALSSKLSPAQNACGRNRVRRTNP